MLFSSLCLLIYVPCSSSLDKSLFSWVSLVSSPYSFLPSHSPHPSESSWLYSHLSFSSFSASPFVLCPFLSPSTFPFYSCLSPCILLFPSSRTCFPPTNYTFPSHSFLAPYPCLLLCLCLLFLPFLVLFSLSFRVLLALAFFPSGTFTSSFRVTCSWGHRQRKGCQLVSRLPVFAADTPRLICYWMALSFPEVSSRTANETLPVCAFQSHLHAVISVRCNFHFRRDREPVMVVLDAIFYFLFIIYLLSHPLTPSYMSSFFLPSFHPSWISQLIRCGLVYLSLPPALTISHCLYYFPYSALASYSARIL